jgi:hypothetical protein
MHHRRSAAAVPLQQPAPWLLSAAGATAASLHTGFKHCLEMQLFAADQSIVAATLLHRALAAACSLAAVSCWLFNFQPANGLQPQP